ncbi:YciI family protein [Microbacterium sp. NIBRBAC000506063]|uniref:YciI family protein n=1 Tax=Microbacterium sp. NIBRBAC000506063 TaxID=2734618 RepID=UPI001CB6CD85|nr:YciI family protein [Microbacterium sp. NIBRBAC000506063]
MHDAAVPPERAQEIYAQVYEWFQQNAAVFAEAGAELQSVETASTVRHRAGGPVIVDGPFTEAREAVGGFAVVDVPDRDAALALARTWPMLVLPGTSVEVRPMVTDYSQFEE